MYFSYETYQAIWGRTNSRVSPLGERSPKDAQLLPLVPTVTSSSVLSIHNKTSCSTQVRINFGSELGQIFSCCQLFTWASASTTLQALWASPVALVGLIALPAPWCSQEVTQTQLPHQRRHRVPSADNFQGMLATKHSGKPNWFPCRRGFGQPVPSAAVAHTEQSNIYLVPESCCGSHRWKGPLLHSAEQDPQVRSWGATHCHSPRGPQPFGYLASGELQQKEQSHREGRIDRCLFFFSPLSLWSFFHKQTKRK